MELRVGAERQSAWIHDTLDPAPCRKLRVLRVIARLNVGGPAYHVSVLSSRLSPQRYETLLVAGRLGRGEGSMEDLAERSGASVRHLKTLMPEISPVADMRAFLALRSMIKAFRPDIVHTHTAKAGMIARTAAAMSRPRPIIVHTFHGHVLEGYFGSLQNGVYRVLERGLARVSDCLIGVSQQTVDDLVRLRVAPRDRFRVVPLGLDLGPFFEVEQGSSRDAFRKELGLAPDDVLVGYVGRLEPIKRLDVAIKAVAHAGQRAPLVFVVVGGGSCLAGLKSLAAELGMKNRVRFLGFRRDLHRIMSGIDIALLTSDNEGTPVFLIEAAAAGRPAVATWVGGIPEIVRPATGELAPPGDHQRLGNALSRLGARHEVRRKMGRAARAWVQGRFTSDRLVRDIDALYMELLARRKGP